MFRRLPAAFGLSPVLGSTSLPTMMIFDRSQPYDLTETTQQLCPIMLSNWLQSKIQIQILRPKDDSYWPDNQLGLSQYQEEVGIFLAPAYGRVAKQLTT